MPPRPETPYGIKTNRREVILLTSRVVLGSSGAISSQTVEGKSGMVITKTAAETGRYTITLTGGKRAALLWVGATVIAADDTAMTSASGIVAAVRDDDIASDGTFEIQFASNTNLADAEITNNLSFMITVLIAKV